MNDVAMNAHVTKAGSYSNRLVRHDPDLPTGKAVHLHREAHRGVQRSNALLFQFSHDLAGDLIDVIAGVVEFEIGDRPGRTANRLSVHPADEAEEGLRRWKSTQDVTSLVVQRRAADLD